MPPKRRASAGTAHAHLAKVLTSPELNSIKNQKVQQKLEAALSKGSKIASPVAAVAAADHGDDQLKVKIQKLEAELDARNHEFEKKQAEFNAQLQQNGELNELTQKENSAMKIEIDTLRLQVAQINSSALNKDGDVNMLKVEKERMNAEKSGLDLLLKQKNAEIESLTASYDELATQLKQLTQERNRYKIKLDDLETERKTAEFDVARLRNQCDKYRDEMQRAVTESDAKEEMLRELKSQLAEERRRKSFDVEEARKDNAALQKRIDMLENDLEEKCNHFQQIQCQSEEMTKEFADIDQNQRNEIISQGRLIDLLKGQLDGQRQQHDDQKAQVEATKTSMDSLVIENTELKNKLIRYEKIINETELEKKKMSKELEDANELLNSVKTKGPQLSQEELEGFSPTAAAAVKLLKSGMTMTEMFSEYIEKSNEAERLSAENERLNECMDEMVADIREKVPMLEKQRKDYENAHQVQQELTEQLDETMAELQCLKRELFHANHSRTRLARENDAFTIQIKTLNKQVAILLGNEVTTSMSKDEAANFYRNTIEMQETATKYQAENKVLVVRIEQLEADGKEDFEAKLKEMSHLLELEKLERSNIEAELTGFKEQRRTWSAYFERQKEVENTDDTDEEMETMVQTSQNSSHKKSPRKSLSNSEDRIKLGLLEQQMDELKESNAERIEEYKEQLCDMTKTTTASNCETMKLQSEMKTLHMNVTMKEESIKRLKEDIALHLDKNNRLMSTMDIEAKNTGKLTEQYMNMREENVSLQIALESSKKRSAMFEKELEQTQQDQQRATQHESGQQLILDTIQQLKQQMDEKAVAETVALKIELDQAKKEALSTKAAADEQIKAGVEMKARLDAQIDLMNKTLAEEQAKTATATNELQRVKSRQILGGDAEQKSSTVQGSAKAVATLETKQLNDEIRTLKAEKAKIESQMAELKRIAQDAEKRMNTANEDYAKSNLVRDKELAELQKTIEQRDDTVNKLEENVTQLKSACGQEDINQLRLKLENAQRELEGVIIQLKERQGELDQSREQYHQQIVQHGKAQEACSTLRSENGALKIEMTKLATSSEVQKARNDSMRKEWEDERDALMKNSEHVEQRMEQQTSQNKLLHDQLQTLNEQVRSSRRRASMSNTSVSFEQSQTAVDDTDEKTYHDILAIQRRELALVETSRDVDRAENLRLKQRIKNLDRQKEETDSLLRDLEGLKSRPSITSEQHAELMEKVNQMNILRESNSVLRDEKMRAVDERDNGIKRIKDLELKLEPLVRRENEFKQEQTKNETEHKKQLEEQTKAKTVAEEEVKKLKATTVPSDQVKKIISVRDEFKQKFDAKSAETRQKEAELTDIRIKCDAAQKKVTELTEQTAKLTEKDKKNEEDAAKEKDKFRRLQQLAKGYRKQVADKTEEIEKTKQEMESKLSDQQNKDDLEVDAEQSKKEESDLAKKMLQNQITKLKQDLASAKTELESSKKELTECQAELAKLQEEHKTVQDKKNKIVANAGKKIKKLQTDLAEANSKLGIQQPSSKETTPKPPTPAETRDVAEVKPAPRPAPQKRVGTVAPLSTPPTTAVVVPTTSVTQQPVTPVAPVQQVEAPIMVETPPAAPTPPPPVAPSTRTISESTSAQDQQMEAELDEIPAPAETPVEFEEQQQPGPSSSTATAAEATLKRPRSETDDSQTHVDETKRARQEEEMAVEDDGVVVIEENDDVEEPEENDDEVVEVPDDDIEPIIQPVVVIPDEDNDELSEPTIEIHAPEPDEVEEMVEDDPVAVPVVPAPQQQQQRPPALNVPPQLSGFGQGLAAQRNQSVAVPSTPNLITTGHGDDNDDGCVPRTPTLVMTGRTQHEGNQSLVSPQVPQAGQPSNRFTFFGSETADPSAVSAVPASTPALASSFGQSAFGSSAAGASSSFGSNTFGSGSGGFASIAGTSSSGGGGFGALSSQRKEEDHSVPGTSVESSSAPGDNAEDK